MKSPIAVIDGQVVNWWVRDAAGERIVEELSSSEAAYSPASTWSHPLLVDRISSGWRPEDEVRTSRQEPGARQQRPSLRGLVRHYVYCPSRQSADAVARDLLEDATVDVRPDPEGDEWMVVIETDASEFEDLDASEEHIERISARHGGDYDGREIG